MSKISNFIKKYNGKENEKITEKDLNDNLEIDIFSLLNEDSSYLSESSDDSYIEKGLNNSISFNNCNLTTYEKSVNNKTNVFETKESIVNYSNEINEHCNNNLNEVCDSNSYSTNERNKNYDYSNEKIKYLNSPHEINKYDNSNKINEQVIDNSSKANISNIILSKKSHIFHSIKILIPKFNEIGKLNDSDKKLCLNLNDDFSSKNIKRENEKDDTDHDKYMKNIIDGSNDKYENNEKTDELLYINNKNIYNFKSFEKIEKDMKEEIKEENILNNIYINFITYENKIKKIEKKRKKNMVSSKNDILFVQNKVQRDINIQKYNSISELYNDIIESINYFNELKVRKAYYCLRESFIKYYCDKKLKSFIENVFISEILYRYKIIRKIEVIFNLDVKKTCEDFINYSVISKRVYRKLAFDYLIDIKDVNGKVCSMKCIKCLSKHNNNIKNIKLASNEIMENPFLENANSNKSFEKFTTVSSETFSENENKKKEKKKKKRILKKKKKRLNIPNKSICNKYIDFTHFNVAFDEDNNEVYYFITKKEFSISKKIASTSNNKKNTYNENRKEQENNDDEGKINLNKFLLKNKKCCDQNETLDNKIIYQNEEKSDINTVIYFYVNLSIPSNFIYVIASLTEVTLFKSWIPFYSFPFKFGISECRTLKERGLLDKMVYAKIAMPWIIKDRYLLVDVWICEDFQFSKGIFLYASNIQKNSEIARNFVINTDNCTEIEMNVHAFISPKTSEETFVKCYVEISPNANLNKTFISFLTNCISHFIKICKEFEFNEEYNNQMKKNNFFYEKLRRAAEESKIY
ncbi:conserved Plasmodium protein, unknown function [Plasmodium gallinaceum]|uniref:Uncharacterized protein n=1 Tax=Plasmodium gallinaceum TaxID=5849 RepID=A0A1J1GVZ6_PLAGA|nr:conserved Plasmodium protein, unknown function [Plasmodium gallinaceum]CRG96638.1 conserved Plasmodium protein, unknown function [Plasmodium gallinaceum]